MIPRLKNKSQSQRENLLEFRQTYIELVNRRDSQMETHKKSPSLEPSRSHSDHQRMILSDLTERGRLARQIDIMRRESPWDLTYLFITAGFNHRVTMAIVILLTLLRYFILADLIYLYIFAYPFAWKYALVVGVARLVFLVLVLKISLKDPESPTQILLRTHWSSKTNSLFVMFELIDARKLFISILRGFCPPELSFLYLSGKDSLKLYQAINYIYFSIESVLFYPPLIIELIILKAPAGALGFFGVLLFALAILAEVMTLSLTGYLYFISCFPGKDCKQF